MAEEEKRTGPTEREQMLMLALRLACRDISGMQLEADEPQEMEEDLMDTYLLEAEQMLTPRTEEPD